MNEDAQREPIHGLDAASLTFWRPCARTLRREYFGLDSQLCLALALSTTSATCLYISTSCTRTQERTSRASTCFRSVARFCCAHSSHTACSTSCHCCALKCSSARRSTLSAYFLCSSARSQSYGTVLAGSAASDPNIFCAMLRSRSASMRFPG